MLRLRMLMPPSRTRETCPRSNLAPILGGENVQHIDILCMSHSVCGYAIHNTSYIIDHYMSIREEIISLFSYHVIIVKIILIKSILLDFILYL